MELFGAAVLDVFDVYAYAVSAKEFNENPSLGTGATLAADAAGLLPIAFGPGRIREGIRFGKKAWDWVRGLGKADPVREAFKYVDGVVDPSRAGEAGTYERESFT